MIRKMRLVNFKSFDDVEIDFSKNNKEIKKNIFIYGENGSGKSNLVSAFKFLQDSLNTLNLELYLESILFKQKNISVDLRNSIFNNLMSDKIFKMNNYRQIGAESPSEVFFEFLFDNTVNVQYYLKFDDHLILEESMIFPLEKNNKLAFKMPGAYFNQALFKNTSYTFEILNEVKRLWGKHSFLAIMKQQLIKNNQNYSKQVVNETFIDIIQHISDFLVLTNNEDDSNFLSIGRPSSKINSMLSNLATGTLPTSDIVKLDHTSDLLSSFFTSLYSDIKGVMYDRKIEDNKTNYSLKFKKIIGGRVIYIPHNEESTGTLKLLELFPYIMELKNHNLVVIDEADTGIHDLLFETIMKTAKEEGNGQLIITTHNTRLLERLDPSEAYVINVDRNGHKAIEALSNYHVRIQKNHNLSKRYLSGAFGGVPVPGYFTLQESGEEYDSSKTKEK